ncbi:hypothetical protein RIF29_11124 [Crotalaria pallida]|uniref:Programmed cell death protein 2 C-terminal domain-containing protein n=1 Tax=Crotalaria pallida TaxID=3830 RepID=A0AAN9ILU1_CROPI
MDKVMLGMPGAWAQDYREPSDPYTTKVGGLPDWPLPNDSLNGDLLCCAACGSKLCLVAQVYAPVSTQSDNIQERFLFIFGCLTPNCATTPQSWRVLRVQKIPEHTCTQDEASATELSSGIQNDNLLEDLNDDMDLEELGKALFEAGTLASKTKTKKKKTPKKRRDKVPASSNGRVTVVDINIPVVPCFYIYAQEEQSPGDLGSICSNYSSLCIKENGSNVEDHSQTEETWEKEHYEYDKALTADRTYLKFKKRLDAYPEQCFRYSYGGKPILAAPGEIDPGRCRLCGRPRQFEMQLMPPLLYFLQEALDDDQRRMVENWDWMTLIVYTCSENCNEEAEQAKSNSKSWIVAEEAVVSQYEESMPIQAGYFS